MNPLVRTKLSIMMFLNFFVWGAWFVTLATYLSAGLKFEPGAIAAAYSTTNWGAIISPFFIGMIADRFFSAERVLGFLHLAGAVVLYYATSITDPGALFWTLVLYAMCYMPSLALTNAISFHQMKDPEKEFPGIRVCGTLGWIVAGLSISVLGIKEASSAPLMLAAGASVAMGLFSFVLPNTPPKSRGKKVTVRDVLGLDALDLLKDPSFAVFILASLLICIPLAFYYTYANMYFNEIGMVNVAGKMTMGQMSEVIFMLLLPLLLTRIGVKKTLIIGMLAWFLRYFLFAYGNVGSLSFMLYTGILLHGICYDFFFVTAMIYVDNETPLKIRASAQGFFAFISYGVGMVVGNIVAGIVGNMFTTSAADGTKIHDWSKIWMAPCLMALVVVVLFLLFFKERPRVSHEDGADVKA